MTQSAVPAEIEPTVAEMREHLRRALSLLDEFQHALVELKRETRLHLYVLDRAEDPDVLARVAAVHEHAAAGKPLEGAMPANEFVERIREKAATLGGR